MAKQDPSCCGTKADEGTRCRVEALVSVDDRGQMVLPKDLREKAGILAGDKLAVVSWIKGDKVCCFTLMKADDMADRVREVLGPIFKEIIG